MECEETRDEYLFVRALKKSCSHLQIIPSEDFDSFEYLAFLGHATPKELSEDILTESTFKKLRRM